MKELDKISVDLILKLITISAFLFLLLNFIFNLGYFSNIGIKYASLLELQDYYEGTAPLTTFYAYFFIGLIFLIKNHELYNTVKALINNWIFLVRINIKKFILFAFRYKTVSISTKKEILNVKREISSINKRFKRFSFIDITIFVLYLLMLITAIIPVYIYLYRISLFLSWVIILLYAFWCLISLFSKCFIDIIFWSVIIVSTISGILGHCAFVENFNNTVTMVTLDNNSQVLLIRPISKGVIVKNNSDIEFYQWNRVEKISKPIKILKAQDVLLSK